MLFSGGFLLLLAVVVLVMVNRHMKRSRDEMDRLDHRIGTLWQELDSRRQEPADPEDHPRLTTGTHTAGSDSPEKVAAERAVYERIWPTIWTLHEKVGAFLRAVEHQDSNNNDNRLAARQAALDLRGEANQLRPFLDETVDQLVHQLLDVEIKAHLAACQFLDNRQAQLGTDSSADIARDGYRQQWHLHHDNEAKEILGHLVHAIRRRTLS